MQKVHVFTLICLILLFGLALVLLVSNFYDFSANSDSEDSFLSFVTADDFYFARQWVAIELTNNGEEPIYYFDSHCDCTTKILKKTIFGFEGLTGCLECTAPQQGKLLNINEKVVLYELIHERGFYKIRIPYSFSNNLESATGFIETNEFEIKENSCSVEKVQNSCANGRIVYRIPPSCEFQDCF